MTKTLLDYAKNFVANHGIQALENYRHRAEPCGCIGPRDGYENCPCAMSYLMSQNKEELIKAL